MMGEIATNMNNLDTEASALINKGTSGLRTNKHSYYAGTYKSKVRTLTINISEISTSKFLSK